MNNKIIRKLVKTLYKLGDDPTRTTDYDIIEMANEMGLRDYDIDELVTQVHDFRE